MDYKGDPYSREPYDRSPSDAESSGYGGNAARGDNPGAEGYEQSPYSQSPYGRSPYNASYDTNADGGNYGGSPYSREYVSGGYGRADSRNARDARGYDRSGRDQSGYGDDGGYARGEEQEGYDRDARGYGRSDYGNTRYGRDEYANNADYDRTDMSGTGRMERPEYGTGRMERPEYGTGRMERPEYGTGRMERPEYGTGRMERPEYGTGRMERPEYGTGRMERPEYGTGRMQRPEYDGEFDAGADAYTEGYDDEEPIERPRKKRKKRSKFSRFMRGLGAYIAQLPVRTLVVIGGGIAVILVGVILLVMFLPKTPKEADVTSGDIGLSDITPTPSLAPTLEPVPTEELPEATPFDNPFADKSFLNLNDVNDLVPTIQERLVELGYMDMPSDGYTTKYGPSTKTAVRLFQIRNVADYHDWDGLMGAGTYELLMADNAIAFYLARGDGDDRTKEITRLVELVKKLQERLITLGYMTSGATGRYGEETVNAVRTFQQYHGLKMDGQAGQSTLNLIYSAEAMDAVTGAANDRSKLSPTPETADAAAGTTPDPNAAAGTPVDVPTDTDATVTPDPATVG